MWIPRTTLSLLLAALLPASVQAHEAGDTLLRFGLLTSQPDTGNETLDVPNSIPDREVELSEDTMPAFSGSYLFHEYLGVGFATSLPLSHNILLDDSGTGSGNVGETGVISPNATLDVHLPPVAGLNAYVGLGFHYTAFFEEDIRNQNGRDVPPGYSLEMDSTTGFVARLGVDYDIGRDWFLNGSVSHFDVESTVKVRDSGGSTVDKADIALDPLQFQIGVARRF